MNEWNEKLAMEAIDKLRVYFRQYAPKSREHSLAVTKLDEAALWLAAASVIAEGKPNG